MQRHLEPELMLDPEQVDAYNKSHRQWGINGFIYLYEKYFNKHNGSISDLGTGTGQYLIALKNKFPELQIYGYDASPSMVECSIRNFNEAHVDIKIVCERLENISLKTDYTISTNTLHHIPNANVFWQSIKNISNEVFVMDLVRPDSIEDAMSIVEKTSQGDSELFKKDYFNSLLAAFSEQELEEQILGTNLNISFERGDTGLKVVVIYGKI